jgi:type II secretory pathway pseudopilin PulG
MNRSDGPYHNILKVWPAEVKRRNQGRETSTTSREGGYTLVALLAVMTIIALFAAAAAPSIRQQAQREREIESIFRGEEVAEAIRNYYSLQGRQRGVTGIAALPTSIDQLLEGVLVRTKKVQVLRASAGRDPLSEDGEWILVRPNSSRIIDFTRAVMVFAENIRPLTNDPQLKLAEGFMVPLVVPSSGSGSGNPTPDAGDNSSGPFIGVTPASQANSILNYYGIERHNEWVFTPFFR